MHIFILYKLVAFFAYTYIYSAIMCRYFIVIHTIALMFYIHHNALTNSYLAA